MSPKTQATRRPQRFPLVVGNPSLAEDRPNRSNGNFAVFRNDGCPGMALPRLVELDMATFGGSLKEACCKQPAAHFAIA